MIRPWIWGTSQFLGYLKGGNDEFPRDHGDFGQADASSWALRSGTGGHQNNLFPALMGLWRRAYVKG